MKVAAITILLASAATASPIAGKSDDASPTELVTASSSTPTANAYSWSEGWQSSYPIHPSCNITLKRQLEDALGEAVELAQHARNHILRFGSKSEFVQKYFGNSSTATAIGWYDRIVAADKGAMTFRCDDPDKNCATQKSKLLRDCLSYEPVYERKLTSIKIGLDTGVERMPLRKPSSAPVLSRSVDL